LAKARQHRTPLGRQQVAVEPLGRRPHGAQARKPRPGDGLAFEGGFVFVAFVAPGLEGGAIGGGTRSVVKPNHPEGGGLPYRFAS
jgi:hypothetical protein